MESWRMVWRKAIAPQFTWRNLEVLRRALAEDDESLIQGGTVRTLAGAIGPGAMPTGACPVAYPGWQDGLETAGEVEEWFGRITLNCDAHFSEPATCRWFLNWWDETRRDVARAALLAEVERSLAEMNHEAV